MSRELSVSGSIHIAVDPETVYDAVSDVRQMGRWSPENRGAQVEGAFEAAYVGMRFVGDNKRGPVRWQTGCTVTSADRGRRFAFDVNRYGVAPLLFRVKVAAWDYAFEAEGGGTLVTETWFDGRPHWPDMATRAFDPLVTRHRSFADFQRGNIARTLKRLKSELESDTTS
ncbi:MAG TPA: SRPBCC family protein [Nocardioidaceae bacterium]|nr:SRPBCC family protein [Nocardioidaceae bacterium]